VGAELVEVTAVEAAMVMAEAAMVMAEVEMAVEAVEAGMVMAEVAMVMVEAAEMAEAEAMVMVEAEMVTAEAVEMVEAAEAAAVEMAAAKAVVATALVAVGAAGSTHVAQLAGTMSATTGGGSSSARVVGFPYRMRAPGLGWASFVKLVQATGFCRRSLALSVRRLPKKLLPIFFSEPLHVVANNLAHLGVRFCCQELLCQVRLFLQIGSHRIIHVCDEIARQVNSHAPTISSAIACNLALPGHRVQRSAFAA